MGFIERLGVKWNLDNSRKVWLALLVFALTGTTVAILKEPVIELLFPNGEKPLWFQVAYWILIFPFYNLLLLSYGALFGLFNFFWSFEKRMFNRLFGNKK